MRAAVAAALVLAASLAASRAGAKEPSFAALQSDVTVVAFFATTCAPCQQELPHVEALQRTVAGDKLCASSPSASTTATPSAARACGARARLTMPIIVDPMLYMALFPGSAEANSASVPRLVVMNRRRRGLERAGAARRRERTSRSSAR